MLLHPARQRRTVRFTGVIVPAGGGITGLLSRRFLLDQVLADYAAAQGDSGAPVIVAFPQTPGNPNDTFLVGIHNGTWPLPTGVLGVFSPIRGVEADLGPLIVDVEGGAVAR